MADVTQLLDAAAAGDPKAAADLLPLIYDELRKLATAKMMTEAPDHTLQPTALVHEAYLRLVGPKGAERWDNRGHFFAAAAEAMRRILVENARRKRAVKHGGRHVRIDLEESLVVGKDSGFDLLDLNDALDQLARIDPHAAGLVKLRFFVGLTGDQAAEALGVSPRSVDLVWAYARAWLFAKLQDADA